MIMHHVSVAGVVSRPDGTVLLVRRRDNDQWQIPGGILEASEFIQEGLLREIAEETGLRVRPVRLTGVYKNLKLQSVALVFLCQEDSGELCDTTDETAEAGWYQSETACGMCIPTFAIRISDALAGAEIPFVRNHDGIQLLD